MCRNDSVLCTGAHSKCSFRGQKHAIGSRIQILCFPYSRSDCSNWSNKVQFWFSLQELLTGLGFGWVRVYALVFSWQELVTSGRQWFRTELGAPVIQWERGPYCFLLLLLLIWWWMLINRIISISQLPVPCRQAATRAPSTWPVSVSACPKRAWELTTIGL